MTEAVPLNDSETSISIVIPTYNEVNAIRSVVSELLETDSPEITEIIVVDDGSTDDTAKVISDLNVKLIRHPSNRGYGAALKSGIQAASGKFILTMDADGQHRIEDVKMLCSEVGSDPEAECIIGARTKLFHSPIWRMPGKWLMRWLAEFITQRNIPDLNSGLRVFRKNIAERYASICPQGFSFSTTITMAMLSRGYRVEFKPIEVNRRTGTSTVTAATGFQALLLMIRI